MMLAAAAMAGLMSGSALGAPSSHETAEYAALSQCIALQTTGADRIMTARWLFAIMSKSPQIADLSAVTAERTRELNQNLAKLLTRLITKDCIDQVRPIAAAGSAKEAFEQVGQALGETAMNELLSGKEAEKGLAEYTEFLSEDDFKPLMDSLPKKSK